MSIVLPTEASKIAGLQSALAAVVGERDAARHDADVLRERLAQFENERAAVVSPKATAQAAFVVVSVSGMEPSEQSAYADHLSKWNQLCASFGASKAVDIASYVRSQIAQELAKPSDRYSNSGSL